MSSYFAGGTGKFIMLGLAGVVLLLWCWYLAGNYDSFAVSCPSHQKQVTGVVGGEAMILCVDRW